MMDIARKTARPISAIRAQLYAMQEEGDVRRATFQDMVSSWGSKELVTRTVWQALRP